MRAHLWEQLSADMETILQLLAAASATMASTDMRGKVWAKHIPLIGCDNDAYVGSRSPSLTFSHSLFHLCVCV